MKSQSGRLLLSVPRPLVLVHRRAKQLGSRRVITEASLVCGFVSLLLYLAMVPLMSEPASPWLMTAVFVTTAALVAGFLAITLPMVHDLAHAQFRAQRLTTHDANGIVNRRHFAQLAQREWERCRRYRSGATLLVVEVDHLASLEEDYGREASEAVMRAVALACDSTLRKPDLLGRHTGEMLAAFLPHTEALGAVDVAERLRAMVAEVIVPWNRASLRVTVSIGVAALGDTHLSLNAFLAEAEAALLAAQKAGRNCVRMSPSRGSRSNSRDYPVMG